jgi:hypothetical protein
VREILLVTLADRLPSETTKQQPLREAIKRMAAGGQSPIEGDYFTLQREDFGPTLEAEDEVGLVAPGFGFFNLESHFEINPQD